MTPSRSVRRRFVRRWTPPPKKTSLTVMVTMRGAGGDTISFSILAMPGVEHIASLHGYVADLEAGCTRLVTVPVSIQAVIA